MCLQSSLDDVELGSACLCGLIKVFHLYNLRALLLASLSCYVIKTRKTLKKKRRAVIG